MTTDLFTDRQAVLPPAPTHIVAGQPDLFRPAAGDVQGPIERALDRAARRAKPITGPDLFRATTERR